MTNLSLTSILFVSILIEEVKISCFVSNWVCVIAFEEIVFPEIVMFVPAIKIFCFELSVSFTFILSSVNGSYIVKEVALISPDMAGV